MSTPPLSKVASQNPIVLPIGKSGTNTSSRQVALLTMVWVVCTLLLFLFRSGYTFPPYGGLDGWIYTAYQWDFKNQISDFGPTYYGSRLSWILPGALFHTILPLLAANISYKLLVSALFATACAKVVHRSLGLSAAMIAVALSVLCPQVIEALHTDYIDTAVIVYAALTLACITTAKDSVHWPVLIFLGGCFFTGMTIANLSALASLGVGVAVFHLCWLRWNVRRQVICVALYLAAAAFVCLAIALIHRWAGGEFMFLKPQFDMITYMKGLKVNPWIPKDTLWFTEATWLLLPASSLLWGLYCSLVAPPLDERKRLLVRSLTAGLATSFFLALFLQIRALNATLSFSFYASFHLCLALPLLVACLFSSTRSKKDSARWILATIGILLIIVFGWTSEQLYGAMFRYLPFLHSFRAVPLMATVILLLVSVLTALVTRKSTTGFASSFLGPELVLIGVFVCSVPISFHGPAMSDRLRERYVAVDNAYQTLARELPRGSYRYWVHPEAKDGVSLASTKLWGFRLFSLKQFPEFEAANLDAITEDQTVVIPSPPNRGNEVMIIATRVLITANYNLSAQRIIKVPGEAGTGFDLVCFSMRKTPIDPEQTSGETVPASALMDLNFDSAQPYTLALGQNLYGPKREKAIDTSSGFPVFTCTDSRDHLATNYQTLSEALPEKIKQISIVATMPAEGHCVCVVQIEECRTIAQITWKQKGRSVHTITVPAGAKSIRLYLQSSLESATALPTRITVYELPQ